MMMMTVMMLTIPNCSVALPAGVENTMADNPLGVPHNWIAGLVGIGENRVESVMFISILTISVIITIVTNIIQKRENVISNVTITNVLIN